MAEKNWATIRETGTSDTTDATGGAKAVLQTYTANTYFDPSAFFDAVEAEASNLGSMEASLRNTLAHAQQAKAQAAASMGLSMGSSGSSEEGENPE